MSRLDLAREAVRPSLKARLMISGPAGAGKTYSALEIATVLADGGRILVIDTEKESALTYASEFGFTHLPWAAPFDPRELGTTLVQAAHDYTVIVVDSFSHFWGGTGGTLDIADGKFGGWKTARPAQNDAVEGILSAPAHVIVCVRSAIEHVQELDQRTGKQVVKKLGLAPKQDKDLEYELNLAVEVSIEHHIAVSKSRTTAVPVGQVFAPGHARDLAGTYRDWLAGGEPFADLTVRASIDQGIKGLSESARRDLIDAWRNNGLPKVDLLTESQAVRAHALIEAAAAHGPGAGAGGSDAPTDHPAAGSATAPTPTDGEGPAALSRVGADGPWINDPDGPATDAQKRMYRAVAKGRTRDDLLAVCESVTGRPIASSNDLTKAEMARVIDALTPAEEATA